MKQMLSVEQSTELIKRGVSADKASEKERIYKPIAAQNGTVHNTYVGDDPTFTLADLFAMLPKGIIYNGLSCKLRITSWYDEPYFAGYMNQVGKYIMGNPYDAPYSAEELIDVIFQLLCWTIDKGHVNLESYGED